MPEKIKKAIIRSLTGRKVPLEYQYLYGKTYDKKEAEKVAYAIINSMKRKRRK